MKRRSQSRQVTYSVENLLPQFDESSHHVEPFCPWSERGLENLLRREMLEELHEYLDPLLHCDLIAPICPPDWEWPFFKVEK